VCFTDVQPSGKPRMTAAAWARGRGVQAGDVFDALHDLPQSSTGA
jgi:hypothetical protein